MRTVQGLPCLIRQAAALATSSSTTSDSFKKKEEGVHDSCRDLVHLTFCIDSQIEM